MFKKYIIVWKLKEYTCNKKKDLFAGYQTNILRLLFF